MIDGKICMEGMLFLVQQIIVLHEYGVLVLITSSIRKNERQTEEVAPLPSSTLLLGRSRSSKFDMN